jgi:septum formation protein
MPLTCSLYPFECQQIDEGVVFRVAGGLLLEHPLTLPFVEAVVGSSDSVMGISKDLANKLIQDAL